MKFGLLILHKVRFIRHTLANYGTIAVPCAICARDVFRLWDDQAPRFQVGFRRAAIALREFCRELPERREVFLLSLFLFPWAQIRDRLRVAVPVTFVTHNFGDERSYEDLWLMTRCRHFVLANSSFSWWGAWLSTRAGKRVIYPQPVSWTWVRNADMMPEAWEGRPA
jgi:hypothetical protein